MVEIDSAAISQLVDGSASDLLKEINDKRRRIAFFGPAVGISVLASVTLLLAGVPTWTLALWVAIAVAGIVAARYRDNLAKSVVILYELDAAVEEAYGKVHDALTAISSCSRTWHISASGAVKDRKYHAGASSVVRRHSIAIRMGQPPAIRANVDMPLIPAGTQTLAFTPERLLIFDRREVGAVPYADLGITVETTRFVEDDPVPPDAQVVDHTWRYVNKKGGPDRRFKDNLQLPIALYEELHFTSKSGLNELFDVSKVGVSASLAEAVKALTAVLLAPSEDNAARAG